MDGTEFVDVFCGDEGTAGARVALGDITAAPDRVVELTYNVWILHVDKTRGLLRYEHDFLDDEGSLPLHEFVAGLQARLEASGG